MDIIRKIAKKVTRPLLRSIQSADDEYAAKLLSMVDFDVSIRFSDEGEIPLGYVLSKSQIKSSVTDVVLEVTLKEKGYEPLCIIGAKDTLHTGKFKSALYKSGVTAADLGELFAFLIILSQLKAVLARLRDCTATDDILYHQFKKIEEHAYEAYCSSMDKVPCYGFVENCSDLSNKEIWTVGRPGGFPVPLMQSYFEARKIHFREFPSAHALRAEKTKLSQAGMKDLPVFVDRQRSLEFMGTCILELGDLHYHDFIDLYATNGAYWPFISKCVEEYWYSLGANSIYHVVRDMYLALHEEMVVQVSSVKYFRELKSEYAKSYQQKKNIPKKTLSAMADSVLNKYFGYVEFDSSCDLEKVEEVTKEFIAIKETYFSFVDSSKNAIRFRLLGNHKATGLYYPFVKCLCVDVRKPSSLVHEYGHLIDYEFGSLSKQYAFLRVREAYKERLTSLSCNGDSAAKGVLNGKGKYNLSYYLEPTEIFARTLEIYMGKVKGVKNSLLPSEFSFAYPTDEEFLTIVSEYFDCFFDSMLVKSDDVKVA